MILATTYNIAFSTLVEVDLVAMTSGIAAAAAVAAVAAVALVTLLLVRPPAAARHSSEGAAEDP